MLLENTKAHLEVEYTKSKQYQFEAVVIYGDTYSVIVKFGTGIVKETFPLVIEAAEKCSAISCKIVYCNKVENFTKVWLSSLSVSITFCIFEMTFLSLIYFLIVKV